MSKFDENKIKRGDDGKFAEKPPAPEADGVALSQSPYGDDVESRHQSASDELYVAAEDERYAADRVDQAWSRSKSELSAAQKELAEAEDRAARAEVAEVGARTELLGARLKDIDPSIDEIHFARTRMGLVADGASAGGRPVGLDDEEGRCLTEWGRAKENLVSQLPGYKDDPRGPSVLLDENGAVASTVKSPDSSIPDLHRSVDGIPQDVPVDVRHPDIQRGAVHDTVEVPGYGVFHRRTDDVYPDQPYAMRVQFSRPVSDDEMQRAAGLVGYSLRTAGQGEPAGDPDRDSPYSFVISADTTKGRAYRHLDRFEENLGNYIAGGGTPQRKTDQAGPGTKGTRLVEGFQQDVPDFELYYDNVYRSDS